MLRIPGVARVGGIAAGKLGRRGLTENHGACLLQTADGVGVLFRYVTLQELRTAFGRETGGFHDVLDADWHPVQGAEVRVPRLGVALRCRFQGVFGVDEGPSIDVRVDCTDPVETGTDEVATAKRSFADASCRLGEREGVGHRESVRTGTGGRNSIDR